MDSYSSMPIQIEGKPPSFEFTSTEHQQVRDFLDKCHLPQYYATFIEEGFESLQAVSIHSFGFCWKHLLVSFLLVEFHNFILDVRDQVFFFFFLTVLDIMVLGVGDYRRGSDRFECKKRTPTSKVFRALTSV